MSSPPSLCSSSEGLSLDLELANLRDPSVSVPSVLGVTGVHMTIFMWVLGSELQFSNC